MAQRKLIEEDLASLNTIKDLAESYEEIAVIRMQKIKDSVIRTRGFLVAISDIYVDLKSSYNLEVKDLIKRMKKRENSLLKELQKNGKILLVYLSSNGKLYGSVTQKTYRLFTADLKKPEYANSDIIIIGSAGKEMFEQSSVNRPFKYFEIPDAKVQLDHIKLLMNEFLKYEKVYIYYGKFGNVINQDPISSSITGEEIFETEVKSITNREDRFIFEPTLEKIYHFFETQIMANLFSQTLLENQLARHASRVNSMEAALINIEDETKKLKKMQVKLKHLIQEKKQLETISGVLTLLD